MKLRKPSGLTDENDRPLSYAAAIFREMEASGLRATMCADRVGLPRDSVSGWLNRGREQSQRRSMGHTMNATERYLADFYEGTLAAHSRWVASTLRVHHDVAAGGLTTMEATLKIDPQVKERDPKTGEERDKVLERRVVTKRLLPDARALEWELQHLAVDVDGSRLFTPRTEVTGAEGGPVEIEDRQAREERVARELLAFQQGVDAQRALEAERSAAG